MNEIKKLIEQKLETIDLIMSYEGYHVAKESKIMHELRGIIMTLHALGLNLDLSINDSEPSTYTLTIGEKPSA